MSTVFDDTHEAVRSAKSPRSPRRSYSTGTSTEDLEKGHSEGVRLWPGRCAVDGVLADGKHGHQQHQQSRASSVQSVTMELRLSNMRSTKSAFMELIQPSEDLLHVESRRLKGYGVLKGAGDTSILTYNATVDRLGFFFDLAASRHLSTISFELMFRPTVSYPQTTSTVVGRWTSYPRMNVDLLHDNNDLTIGESLPRVLQRHSSATPLH
eukprot:RCo026266